MPDKQLALVTGASTGIGLELAKCAAEAGFDLVISADEAAIERAAAELRPLAGSVQAVQADLATTAGVDKLCAAVGNRPINALLANAGVGLGKAFLDQDVQRMRRVVDTNITGTALSDPPRRQRNVPAQVGTHLDHGLDRGMRAR
jgi:short-subunit dehydrogenase